MLLGGICYARSLGYFASHCLAGEKTNEPRLSTDWKKANNAYAISHSHRRTKKLQEVNLQWKRVWWPEGNRWVRLRLSTKAIKTLERKGLSAFAKEAGLNLNKL